MTAYFVFHYTIPTDAEAYKKYLNRVGELLTEANAKVLVAGAEHTVIEGSPAPVTVVLEFESREAAEQWYQSDAYQQVKHLRTDHSDGWAILTNRFGT